MNSARQQGRKAGRQHGRNSRTDGRKAGRTKAVRRKAEGRALLPAFVVPAFLPCCLEFLPSCPSCLPAVQILSYLFPETKSKFAVVVAMILWLTAARPTYTDASIGIVSVPTSVHTAPSGDSYALNVSPIRSSFTHHAARAVVVPT